MELSAAGEYYGLGKEALFEIAYGVWGLVASDSADRFLQDVAPRLACVRDILSLHGAPHTCAESVAAAAPGILSPCTKELERDQQSSATASLWSLEIEMRSRPVDLMHLPFQPSPSIGLALLVAAAITEHAPGFRYCPAQQGGGAAEQHAFIVVEATGSALLLCERVKTTIAEEPKRLPFGAGSEMLAGDWHRAWTTRPFLFSACLDSRVAASVLSLSLMLRGVGPLFDVKCVDGTSRPTLLDACTGSGTFAATAAASGLFGAIFASELDTSFAERARENMVHMEVESSVEILNHDATQDYPEAVNPDIVVCNPPWGWRLKAKPHRMNPQQDAPQENVTDAIVFSMLRQFPFAVHGFVCPELPDRIHDAGFTIHHRCPLGQSAVWILRRSESEQ